MAAYATLVSVMHIIGQIQNHPRPPISFAEKQVKSLTEKVTFLQEFLEVYSLHGDNEEAEYGLLSRIADAAHAAEDVIECYVVDQIHAGSSSSQGGNITFIDFYQGLQKVIEDLDYIKKEVMDIKGKTRIQQYQLSRSSMPDDSSRFPSMGQTSGMVGLDDVLIEMMDKLTGPRSDRQIIPIVGMGGIGKTTLARSLYVNPLIKHHFDIVAWVTISQNYNTRDCLEVLCQVNNEKRETLSEKSENELGQMVHQTLWSRRYLIIMDDIWSIEAWDQVKNFFPDYNNGSRVVMTTRLSNLAFQLTGSYGLEINFLDEDKSWILLCQNVFGEEDCPIELKEIGKKIARCCKGLPLSIVVVGGLLARFKHTQEYWEYVAKNLTSIVNLENNERCLKVLRMSYNELPVHLKPCFLYMGIFPEDKVISVSLLIKLWVAEGFLKPNSEKSLEMVAKEYLNELIDRNLILVHERGSSGKVKSFNIHDLIWDLCLKQAQKEKFLCVIREQSFSSIPRFNTQRRIFIHHEITAGPKVVKDLISGPVVRSLICEYGYVLPLHRFRLLRVLKADSSSVLDSSHNRYIRDAMFQQVNLRLLVTLGILSEHIRFPSSSYLLWNLQILVATSSQVIAPPEIWKMSQLRHIRFDLLQLPEPPASGDDLIVLEHLQTLSVIQEFKCSEEVVKRIPNIKKLRLRYSTSVKGMISSYCLSNLGRLHKLEFLQCACPWPSSSGLDLDEEAASQRELVLNITFPHSLKKLILERSLLHWEDMATKIGPLPHLQVLKLYSRSFIGSKWETVEGQFCSLKYLQICWCDLEDWETESAHFPRLEKLVLSYMKSLKEIPRCIGDIPTLQSIEFESGSDSSIISAKEIIEEQEELGNDGLRVRVELPEKNEVLQSLVSPNFHVEIRARVLRLR